MISGFIMISNVFEKKLLSLRELFSSNLKISQYFLHSLIYIVNKLCDISLINWSAFQRNSNKSKKIFAYDVFLTEKNVTVLDNKHSLYFLNREYINLYFQQKGGTTATFVANRMLHVFMYM